MPTGDAREVVRRSTHVRAILGIQRIDVPTKVGAANKRTWNSNEPRQNTRCTQRKVRQQDAQVPNKVVFNSRATPGLCRPHNIGPEQIGKVLPGNFRRRHVLIPAGNGAWRTRSLATVIRLLTNRLS